jgi:hypothetical protein
MLYIVWFDLNYQTMRNRFHFSIILLGLVSTEALAGPPETVQKNDFLQISAGYAHLSYNQVGLTPLSESNLMIQGSYTHLLDSSFSLVASTQGSFPIHANPTGMDFDLFGVDARAGFSPHWPESPWKLTLFVGAHYLATFSSSFGYNFLGPEFYPELERNFADGSGINAHFKFSTFRGDGDLTLSNHEIGGGIGYAYPLHNGHPLSLNFDYTDLEFNSNQLSLTQSTESLSVGYGF